jgi:hypothetical protein
MVDQICDSLRIEDYVVGAVAHRGGGDEYHLQGDSDGKITRFNRRGRRFGVLPSCVC